MAITSDQIRRWGVAPSEREEIKCQRTVERIKTVLQAHFGNVVEIYLQGSYRNRTNVRLESDVDIVVEHSSYYFHDISSLSEEDKRRFDAITFPAQYQFSQYKQDVHALMQREFGVSFVQRKNKCIFITKDSYRVNADVVPAYQYKRFYTPTSIEAQGIAFLSDGGEIINSFPKQHYENGASKNINTNGNYKSVVRVLKNVQNVMIDARIISEDLMASFLLECLVWNVPDADFNRSSLYDVARQVIWRIWDDMNKPDKAANYAEVSNLKWLLRGNDSQGRVQNVRSFMQHAWNFIGYVS
jgi:predicted nucleotidyltransferase